MDSLKTIRLKQFMQEFEGVARVFKGLIFKYEDVINDLDKDPGDDIIETMEKINESLKTRTQQVSG